MALDIVIMAAGKGTRMKSALPKVLHRLAGRQPIAACSGHLRRAGGRAHASSSPATAPTQVEAAARRRGPALRAPGAAAGHRPRRAAGGAARCDDDGTTLILNGDVPLIRADTARALVDGLRRQRLALLTIELADPSGYGRIVRDGAGACAASSSTRTPTRRSARSARSTPASWPRPPQRSSAGSPALTQRQRAGRVLPDRHRRHGRGRRRAGGGRARRATRPRCWASTARCSWPSWSAAPAPAGRGADGRRRAPGRPGALRPARRAAAAAATSRSTSTASSKAASSWATACASARTA